MSAALEWLHERVGAMVVKEVRQGLRSRAFVVLFALGLLACLLVALVAAAFNQTEPEKVGRAALTAYCGLLAFLCCFAVPFGALRSTAREREDQTWVLLALTGLSGSSIIRGKFGSALVQAALFASVCSPFVVFTYFLNGVSVVQVVLSLLILVTASTLATAVAVGVAAEPTSRVGRGLAAFAGLGALGGLSAIAAGLCLALIEDDPSLSSQFIAVCAGLIVGIIALSGLVLEGAGAALALPTEAVARRPRQALLAAVVAGWALGAVAVIFDRSNSDEDFTIGAIFTCLALVGPAVYAVSELDGWPRGAGAQGWLARPGARRSFVLILAMLAGTTALWVGLRAALSTLELDKYLRGILAAPLYVALYLSLGVLIGRYTLAGLGSKLGTRLGFAGAASLAIVFSPLASVVVKGRGDDFMLNVLNPMIGLINFADRNRSIADEMLVFLAVITGGVVLAAYSALVARDGERVR